jgi:4-aminobutyrate aminotransferase-like enzyme
MRERQVLISRIGPRDNVLKIRPPLCLRPAEIDQLVAALAETLAQVESARA